MLKKLIKSKVTDISELIQLGLRMSWNLQIQIPESLTFETPAAVSNTIFSGACSVGYLTSIRRNSQFACADIGRFCSIAPNAFVGGGEHPTDWLSTHGFQYGNGSMFATDERFLSLVGRKNFAQPRGRIQIGNDVWLGEGVHISRGVTIGHGAIVAARSVVTKDVAPYAIAAGVPARLLRYRFTDDIIEKLLKLEWWNYNLAPISKQIDYSDIQQAIETIETAIQKRTIHKLKPNRRTLSRKGTEHFLS